MRKLMLCLLIGGLLVGCTTKRTKIGAEDSGLPMREITMTTVDDSLVTNYYCYEDTATAYTNNPYATVGHYRGITAVTLMRFLSVPDTEYVNPVLVLKTVNKDHVAGMKLKIGLLREEWLESQVTWNDAETDTPWIDSSDKWDTDTDFSEYTVPDDADSMMIPLPSSLVKRWIDDNADTNFGFALYSTDPSGFVSWHTLYDSDTEPYLTYKYQVSGEDTLRTRKWVPTADATIFDKSISDEPTFAMQISSSVPQRTYIKCNLSYDAICSAINRLIETGYISSDYQFLDETQFKRTTINRAVLVLPIKSDQCMFNTNVAATFALMVVGTDPVVPFDSDYLKSFAYTNVSYISEGSDELEVDVTPLVQAITSGNYANHGFVIKSYTEDREFTHLEFDPSQVKLRLYYTVPYTED